MVLWCLGKHHVSIFFLLPPQTQPNSVLSGKADVSCKNGHHAESWKSSKQQSLHESSEKIKVITPFSSSQPETPVGVTWVT